MHLPNALIAWDRHAFLAINRACPNRFLDWTMPMATNLGLGYVQGLAILGVALLAATWCGELKPLTMRTLMEAIRRRKWWVAPLLTAVITSGLASDIIKNLSTRSRPWWFYEQEHRAGRHLDVHIRTVPGVYPLKVRGFPSGHTATSVGLATGVTLLTRRRRRRYPLVAAVWFLAAVIAFSRLYLASHWPLDVLGAALLGAMCAWASVRWWERRFSSRGRRP